MNFIKNIREPHFVHVAHRDYSCFLFQAKKNQGNPSDSVGVKIRSQRIKLFCMCVEK